MILILSGLPGSGKSRYALEWLAEDPNHRTRINYDDLRGNTPFSREHEKGVKATARSMAVRAIAEGRDIIIDNTNLTESARAPWVGLGKEFGVPVEQADIDTPIEVCVARDRDRTGRSRVGRAVIEQMALHNGWIDWSTGYNPNQFVIVDVDGTLANNDHRSHFVEQPEPEVLQRLTASGNKWKADWQKFHENVHLDEPYKRVFELVDALSYRYTILIVSGRWVDSGCGIKTEDWLDKHWPTVAPERRYRHLFMRKGGDSRPDTVIKKEILELLPRDRIAFTIDDRNTVVKMWRDEGLTCLQVADGNF